MALPNPTITPINDGDDVTGAVASAPHNQLLANDQDLDTRVSAAQSGLTAHAAAAAPHSGHAPTGHASPSTSYGVASSSNYGHVKCPETTAAGASHSHALASASAHGFMSVADKTKLDRVFTGSVNNTGVSAAWAVPVSGWTVQRTGLGEVTITHNLGTYGYTIVPAAIMSTTEANDIGASIKTKSLNSVVVRTHFGQENATYQAVDRSFDFILIRV